MKDIPESKLHTPDQFTDHNGVAGKGDAFSKPESSLKSVPKKFPSLLRFLSPRPKGAKTSSDKNLESRQAGLTNGFSQNAVHFSDHIPVERFAATLPKTSPPTTPVSCTGISSRPDPQFGGDDSCRESWMVGDTFRRGASSEEFLSNRNMTAGHQATAFPGILTTSISQDTVLGAPNDSGRDLSARTLSYLRLSYTLSGYNLMDYGRHRRYSHSPSEAVTPLICANWSKKTRAHTDPSAASSPTSSHAQSLVERRLQKFEQQNSASPVRPVADRLPAHDCSNGTDEIPKPSVKSLIASFNHCSPVHVQEACDVQEKNAQFYHSCWQREQSRLTALCIELGTWLSDASLSDEASGEIRLVIGKASLLLRKKLHTFGDLCEKVLHPSLPETNEPRTLLEDVAGYWDLVSIELSDIDAAFARLTALKNNGWQQAAEAAIERPVRTTRPSKAPPKPPTGRADAKQRLQQAKLAMRAKNESTSVVSTMHG